MVNPDLVHTRSVLIWISQPWPAREERGAVDGEDPRLGGGEGGAGGEVQGEAWEKKWEGWEGERGRGGHGENAVGRSQRVGRNPEVQHVLITFSPFLSHNLMFSEAGTLLFVNRNRGEKFWEKSDRVFFFFHSKPPFLSQIKVLIFTPGPFDSICFKWQFQRERGGSKLSGKAPLSKCCPIEKGWGGVCGSFTIHWESECARIQYHLGAEYGCSYTE